MAKKDFAKGTRNLAKFYGAGTYGDACRKIKVHIILRHGGHQTRSGGFEAGKTKAYALKLVCV